MPGKWEHSTRGSRLPADWHARRAATYRRAGGRCQHLEADGTRCTTAPPLHRTGDTPGGHADHILRDAGDEPANLQWLCAPHHRAKTTIEGNTARPQERRETETHPGLA